ncbi:UDP-N-acetylmuramoylalanine--D-glutamate ligase [Deinococcus wulumuqiensis]|uniref:UDP-N-acetylmuramoylalanine--D-glutamate ligase n=1 Tax=Deinococcus wulumuqiensis TaxID=980427 RepID=A0AAV4K9V8_9DEIO|nr:UDP-N-acetylmuramoylalanine--D-glutamate ligase [Deinococcus wulumuqiensis]GGP30846.1 UDP-N-acetylmuramoylalanine--D-glutamate ligase [Deinococcus wulumuqiensis]
MPYGKAVNLGGRVLIYGLGRSGRGVARFLSKEGVRAFWHDLRPTPEDEALMEQLGHQRADLGGSYDVVVAAPGVPIDHRDLSVLAGRGAEIIGEVALAARLRPGLPLVGITGTAGKGSTTVLIAQLLRACGLRAREGGNIDPPLLDVVDDAEVAVVELSSFQLERVPGLRLPVAVITNLGVDHLDRHGSVENYHAAKLNITAGQRGGDVLVRPADLPVRTQAQTVAFTPERLALRGGQEVLTVAELPPGVHPANAAAALLAAEATLHFLGREVDPEVLAGALRSAQPVRGRFETVGQLGAVSFIEDSIATRTIAVESALRQAPPPIAWLVGGRDKGADLAPLRAAAEGRVVRVIAFGEDGEALARGLGLPFEIVRAETGDESMTGAVRAGWEALGGAGGAGTVLLAPVGTSFDQFRDYQQRGESFRRAVQALLAGAPGDGA